MPAKRKGSSRSSIKPNTKRCSRGTSDDIENDDRRFKKQEHKEKMLAEIRSFR